MIATWFVDPAFAPFWLVELAALDLTCSFGGAGREALSVRELISDISGPMPLCDVKVERKFCVGPVYVLFQDATLLDLKN